MGREEKRVRERMISQLTKRLRRSPTDEEIETAVASQQEAQDLAAHLGRNSGRPVSARRSQRPR